MTQAIDYAFDVSVATEYLDEESSAAEARFVFAYTIRIENSGSVPARLLRRHWRITDANGEVEEVHGEGVVGETPWLRPGDGFEYVSGVVLNTHVGTMEGSYDLVADDGTEFAATIPRFTLTVPRTLH
ncbi:Co2+/Mg2+ efflux protein ApaG [Lysobacter soyae]|jgi:ApaG protein|uniref:Protein ApaG n=1 Tax=Lysobacter soyae TaxID=2764185 RepID=A0ABX8WRN2_9GAMM|nr:Co2+/Mg2+ efflux protein ApaG [Lysobacter sp. CJ11]QYR53494.1 Co2+/Mg2+ efflux protein ApaG [Lysobacter sp. CJ11]